MGDNDVLNMLLLAAAAVIWIVQAVVRFRKARNVEAGREARRDRRTRFWVRRDREQVRYEAEEERGAAERQRRLVTERRTSLSSAFNGLMRRAAALENGPAWMADRTRDLADRARTLDRSLGGSDDLSISGLSVLSQEAGLLAERLDLLERMAADRTGDHAWGFLVSDAALDGLAPALVPEGARPVALAGSVDPDTVAACAAMNLVPVAIPAGWWLDVGTWPKAVSSMLSGLWFANGAARGELFDLVGLPPRWAVVFSEPMYVSSEDVLGPFGAWLDGIVLDVIGMARFGPQWAWSVAASVAREQDTCHVDTLPSGVHLSPAMPACLRMPLLVRILEQLGWIDESNPPGRDDSFEDVTRRVMDRSGLLVFPTRRNTFYQVPVDSFLQAGIGLVDYLFGQRLDVLGGTVAESVKSEDWRAAWNWAPRVRAGAAMSGSVVARLSTGLFLTDAASGQAKRLARSLLAGLVAPAGTAAFAVSGRTFHGARPSRSASAASLTSLAEATAAVPGREVSVGFQDRRAAGRASGLPDGRAFLDRDVLLDAMFLRVVLERRYPIPWNRWSNRKL